MPVTLTPEKQEEMFSAARAAFKEFKAAQAAGAPAASTAPVV